MTASEFLPQLQRTLTKDLKPWLKNDVELPTLTVEYLARLSNLSITEVIKLIESQKISLTDSQGVSWQPQLICDLPPEQEKTVINGTRRNEVGRLVPFRLIKNERISRDLNDVRELNQSGLKLNPKKIDSSKPLMNLARRAVDQWLNQVSRKKTNRSNRNRH